MRTTIELPDELLVRAKSQAALAGVSLRLFFIAAIEEKLHPRKLKTRKPPPVLGKADGPRIGVLNARQIDEAMFG